MTGNVDDVGAELSELGREECFALLSHAGIGRVVMSAACLPVAFPVNFCLVDGDIVFATGPGAKLDAARRKDVVAIEVDHVDRMYHTGWSVLVTGTAEVVDDVGVAAEARRLLTQAWMAPRDPHLVRVPSTLVSGRRLTWGVHDAPRAPGTDAPAAPGRAALWFGG